MEWSLLITPNPLTSSKLLPQSGSSVLVSHQLRQVEFCKLPIPGLQSCVSQSQPGQNSVKFRERERITGVFCTITNLYVFEGISRKKILDHLKTKQEFFLELLPLFEVYSAKENNNV